MKQVMFQFKTLKNSTINEKGTPKCTKRVVGQTRGKFAFVVQIGVFRKRGINYY